MTDQVKEVKYFLEKEISCALFQGTNYLDSLPLSHQTCSQTIRVTVDPEKAMVFPFSIGSELPLTEH